MTAGLTTILSLASVLLIYFREFIKVLGSYAILGQLLLALGILLAAYYIGFGLKKNQRSAMALGMSSQECFGNVRSLHRSCQPPTHTCW